MCGICGAVWTSVRKFVDSSTLARATDALEHRGPNARGTLQIPITPAVSLEEKGVAFGHRRLAIVDLSDAGRQPFANADQSIFVTFNGEIYNYLEIRDELTRRGHTFQTETDVEVLLSAYEEFGLDFLPKLNGMFAFAIWDSKRRRLVVARDRIGKKPLFYRFEPDRFVFASELKSLRLFADIPNELDLIALRRYLTYQYVPHPRTIYRGVAKLPPATCAVWTEGRGKNAPSDLSIFSYWKPENVANFDERTKYEPGAVERALKNGELGAARFGDENGWFENVDAGFENENGAFAKNRCVAKSKINDDIKKNIAENDFSNRSFEDTARALRRRLEEATRVRMRCDVPFGAFLSGGIDSTIVVGLMRQFSSGKVRTFSIGFAQKEYDETPFARRTAARFGTEHTEFFVEPDAEAILPSLVRQYDEPFADSSAIPTWYLCETTKREATVALGGDGGDELFCGYDRYKAVQLAQKIDKIPLFLRRFLAGPFRRAIPNSVCQRSPLRRARRFLETLGMEPIEQYLQWIAIFNRSRLNSLLTNEYWNDCAKQVEERGFDGFVEEEGRRVCADELDCVDFLDDAYRKFSRRDLTSAISFVDLTTYLPCDLMTKVDVASMRSALEVRAPMLDPNVVELALQIPLKYKLCANKGKYILREACRDLLPDEIDARPKTGFGVPLDAWFRGSLNGMLKETLLGTSTSYSRYFDRKEIEKMINEHENCRFDHSARLWALLVFRLWELNQTT